MPEGKLPSDRLTELCPFSVQVLEVCSAGTFTEVHFQGT